MFASPVNSSLMNLFTFVFHILFYVLLFNYEVLFLYILAWQICSCYSLIGWKWHLFRADIIRYLSVDFSGPRLLCWRSTFSEALLQCYPLYLPFTDYVWEQCGDSWHVWRSLLVTLDHYVRKHFRSQIPDPVQKTMHFMHNSLPTIVSVAVTSQIFIDFKPNSHKSKCLKLYLFTSVQFTACGDSVPDSR